MSDLLTEIVRRVVALERLTERLAVVETQYGLKGARVFNSVALAIPDSLATVLTFNGERWDTDGCHSIVANTSRLTCKTAGEYHIYGHVQFAANAVGIRELRIKLDGASYIAIDLRSPMGAGNTTRFGLSTCYQLLADQYVQLEVLQTSGGALNVDAAPYYSPEFGMTRIG